MPRQPKIRRRYGPWLSASGVAAGVVVGVALAVITGQALIALPCMAAGIVVGVLVPTRGRELPPPRVVDDHSPSPASVLRRYFHEVIQEGHLEVASEVFSHSHIYSDPDGRPFAAGPSGMRAIAALFRAVIPEPRVSVTRLVDEEDMVSVSVRVTGELHDGSRVTSIPLRWRCRIAARQVVATTGDFSIYSRLSWMLPEGEPEPHEGPGEVTAEFELPERPPSSRGASRARRRTWFT